MDQPDDLGNFRQLPYKAFHNQSYKLLINPQISNLLLHFHHQLQILFGYLLFQVLLVAVYGQNINLIQENTDKKDVIIVDPHLTHFRKEVKRGILFSISPAPYNNRNLEKYLKYKPDEQARSISQTARLRFPHANNEAQQVHSHQLIQTDWFSTLK